MTSRIPGFIGTYVYRMDKDPDEFYLVVMFDDKATYRRNAEDPAQDRRYRELRELLAEDPEWHDGEIAWASSALPPAVQSRRGSFDDGPR